MLHSGLDHLLHELFDPLPVFVCMDVFVPFEMHDHLVLVNLRHPALGDSIKEIDTKREGNADQHQHPFFVSENEIDTSVVEPVEGVLLYRVVDLQVQPPMVQFGNTIDKFIEHR